MPTSLSVDAHLATLEAAAGALADNAAAAGLDAPVPTCPRWTVADLVGHQAMVHRWAAGVVRAEDFRRSQTDIVAREPNLLAYYRDGAADLLAVLRAAPDDVDAMVFLRDAPAPRTFWARRQAHETTIHGVDALAARLGRVPVAAECALAVDVALDGIDELVAGFLPRGRPRLRVDREVTIAVCPTDAQRAWTLRVGPERVTTTAGASTAATVTFIGTAAELYLGLWNRGEEIGARGDHGLLDQWRREQQVHWR